MDKVITPYAALFVEKACIDAYLEIINISLANLSISASKEYPGNPITMDHEPNKLIMSDSFMMTNSNSSPETSEKQSNQNTIDSDGQKTFQKSKLPVPAGLTHQKNTDVLLKDEMDNKANSSPSSSVVEGNARQSINKQMPEITHSTPVKKQIKDYKLDLSRIELNTGKYKVDFEKTLSSNLGLIVGDLGAGTETATCDSDYTRSDAFVKDCKQSRMEQGKQVPSYTRTESSNLSSKPSTLDLEDLESVESESESESSMKDLVRDLEKRHSKEIEELQIFYETEIRNLRQERDILVKSHQIPSHSTSLINLKYLDEIKSELERRCQQYELRNRQLTLKVDGLSRSCFESERRCRVLETDKSILQERCYKIDQEKRKSVDDLSKVQDLLNDSLSSRRKLEDELLKLKRKEINSESRLSDSDHALKELREGLNSSRHDNEEKTELIRNITAQRDEIQDNLNDALRQISRLEEASSQRTTEKNLFQKLLEEYEVLYNQHQRIRGLYNDALKKLDGDFSESEATSSPKIGRKLAVKIDRGNSSRKKWSMSPNSPSIREQDDPFHVEKDSFRTAESSKNQGNTKVEVTGAETLRQTGWRRETRPGINRNSTGSILSWETSTDANNNISQDTYNKGRRSENDDKGSWKSRSFPEDPSQAMSSMDSQRQGYEKDDRNWIVHNLNGITRFDVVFSSPNQRENVLRDSHTEKKQLRHSLGKEPSPFSHMQASGDGNHEKSMEIANLERDLMKLSGEKNEIESQLSRLPSAGSGRSRKINAEKQELLEERLEEVLKCIGNIKMTLKRHKAL